MRFSLNRGSWWALVLRQWEHSGRAITLRRRALGRSLPEHRHHVRRDPLEPLDHHRFRRAHARPHVHRFEPRELRYQFPEIGDQLFGSPAEPRARLYPGPKPRTAGFRSVEGWLAGRTEVVHLSSDNRGGAERIRTCEDRGLPSRCLDSVPVGEAAAIYAACGTTRGLGAGSRTAGAARAIRGAQRIEAGRGRIDNDCDAAPLPFDGCRPSGHGRGSGRGGTRFVARTESVCFAASPVHPRSFRPVIRGSEDVGSGTTCSGSASRAGPGNQLLIQVEIRRPGANPDSGIGQSVGSGQVLSVHARRSATRAGRMGSRRVALRQASSGGIAGGPASRAFFSPHP